MKKTYLNPTLKVVKIQPTHLLAGSDMGIIDDYDSEKVQIGARRARFSTWEDEEEEY